MVISFEDVQKLGLFGKRDVFFSKEHLKVFKNTKQGYFPLECFSKVFISHAISKSSKLIFFVKKWSFFAKKSLKEFISTIWHFLSRLRVRLSWCFGILKTIKILVCLEKKMLSLKRSLFSSRFGKRGIFNPACVSKSIFAQENRKRSTAWDFRESRFVIWKNCLNFFKNADIGNISIECHLNVFFCLKILRSFKFWIFLEKKVGLFGK